MYLKKRYLATAVLMLSPWLFAMTQIYAEEANVNLETDLVVGNVGKVEEAVVVEFTAEEDNKETAVDSSDVVAEKEIPNPVTKPEEEHATEVNSDTEHSSPKVEEPPLVVDEVVAKNGIVEEAGNWYYYEDDIRQFDVMIALDGKRYYFEPEQYRGVMSRNKWAYSPNAKAWYHSINVGYLDIEIAPGGYVVGGKKQYDAIAEVMGNFFYFEPERYHGWMSRGKWAYSPRTQLWYRTNNEGHINLVDKVGPVLPRTVKLDDGSMKVFTHYNWQRLESGCYLRATANGMNAIGFDVTPATIWNALPKTNDPRTGILGNPVVSNNWDLGGAYSAAYPTALMPIIQQYSQHSEDITGASLEDIKRELANGNTVQVFYAWVKPNVRLNSGNGVFYASKDYHSVLLTGYTDHGFYHLESWGAIHNEYLANSKLSWQYNLMGKMAIAFRKTKPTLTATPVQN